MAVASCWSLSAVASVRGRCAAHVEGFLFSLWLYVYIIEGTKKGLKRAGELAKVTTLYARRSLSVSLSLSLSLSLSFSLSLSSPGRAIKIFRYVVSLKITIFKFQKSMRAALRHRGIS